MIKFLIILVIAVVVIGLIYGWANKELGSIGDADGYLWD